MENITAVGRKFPTHTASPDKLVSLTNFETYQPDPAIDAIASRLNETT